MREIIQNDLDAGMFYVFPDSSVAPQYNRFLSRILDEVRIDTGFRHQYIGTSQLIDLSTFRPMINENSILINWLDTLYTHFIGRYRSIVISQLPLPIQDSVAFAIFGKIKQVLQGLKANGYRIVFYFHDTISFTRISLFQKIDALVRPFLYEWSDAVVFAEKSARDEIFSRFGACSSPYISCLGNYREFYGKLPDQQQCRNEFGVPTGATVILAAGTLRRNRKIDDIIDVISSKHDLFLLAGGAGHQSLRKENIYSVSGFLEESLMLRMISCTDYFLHTGRDYLTSATVRMGISYYKPIIAELFGSTIDMSKGALVEYPSDRAQLQRVMAELPRAGSLAYDRLVKEASLRDAERTWESSAKGMISALDIESKSSVQ